MSTQSRRGHAAIKALRDLSGLSEDGKKLVRDTIAMLELETNPQGVVHNLSEQEQKILDCIRAGMKTASQVAGALSTTSTQVNTICGRLFAKGFLLPAGYFFRLAQFEVNEEYADKGVLLGAKMYRDDIIEYLEGSGASDLESIQGACQAFGKLRPWEATHVLHALARHGSIWCEGKSKLWVIKEPTKT